MQYQSSLDHNSTVELALQKYFANVDAKNIEAVLDCFHDNAMITVQTAFTIHEGKAAIRRMFEDFMATYASIVHRDFECSVDAKNGRIAASFTAELKDDEGRTTLLENTNFWRIRDDRFQEVYIYMSGQNPLV